MEGEERCCGCCMPAPTSLHCSSAAVRQVMALSYLSWRRSPLPITAVCQAGFAETSNGTWAGDIERAVLCHLYSTFSNHWEKCKFAGRLLTNRLMLSVP